MPPGDRGPPRVGFLLGVVGEAGGAGDGEADRPADEQKRPPVLLVLAEEPGDPDGGEVRVGDLAGA